MNCNVAVTIISNSGVQYYYPEVDLNNFFESMELDEHDPDGIVVGVGEAKFRTKPENVHIGFTLTKMVNICEQMPDEHLQALKVIVDDLITENEPQIKIVPDPEPDDCTNCEACSCEKYLVGDEDDGREED